MGVGVRRRALRGRERERESKWEWVLFFLKSRTVMKPKHSKPSACMWGGGPAPYSMWLPTSKTTFIILIATMVPVVGSWKGWWWGRVTVRGAALLTFVRLIDSRIHGVCHYRSLGYSPGSAFIEQLIIWRSGWRPVSSKPHCAYINILDPTSSIPA